MGGVITLKNISKVYNGLSILQNIEMTIEKGQSVAFTGHNGTGKSTMLKLIAGLVRPDNGKVLCDKDLLFHYIPEHFPPSKMTARQYINSIGKIDGGSKSEIIQKSKRLFDEFFVTEMVDLPMKHLSKGTLQKIGVIQALMKTPDILLLDEPLSGQDVDSQSVFIEKMNTLKKQGVTLIMSCHERFLIHRISDKVYQIEGGSVSVCNDFGQGIEEEQYSIIFECSDYSRIPEELKSSFNKMGADYRIMLPASETNRVILLLIENGCTLRGMYHENN